MLRDARPSFDGRFYRAKEAMNSPHPIQANGLPILIGGNGEKRTLRLVARYADESNLTCAPAEIPQKLEALERHCAELGRDRSEICVTWLGSVVLAPTRDEARRARASSSRVAASSGEAARGHARESTARSSWATPTPSASSCSAR